MEEGNNLTVFCGCLQDASLESLWSHWSLCGVFGALLEPPDLVDVVLHHLGRVELHVAVSAGALQRDWSVRGHVTPWRPLIGPHLAKQLVVVLVLVVASLHRSGSVVFSNFNINIHNIYH